MPRCLSTFVELDTEGYSPAARAKLADRKTFPHKLDFDRKAFVQIRAQSAQRMSISGVQEKLSLKLERGKLIPVDQHGEYILKPVPGQSLPRFHEDVPANESVTMQLAERFFGIETAANACIRFVDNELAYITRRFDRLRDGDRVAQEDFCQLMMRSPETTGQTYKYDASYEELGNSLKKYCGAYAIEVEKLFRRIVFNYAIANGDAHLKNFSLRQVQGFGDYVLSPAYDLLCTKLHIPNESRLALDLFAHDEIPAGVQTHGFVTGLDFLELARRFGMPTTRAESILDEFCEPQDSIVALINDSFLSVDAKEVYCNIVADRQNALRIRR